MDTRSNIGRESPVKNILLVEDEMELQEIISYVLEGEGYTVNAAPSAEKALDECKNRRHDLIISDLHSDFGLESLREIRLLGKAQKTPFVFLTAYGDETATENAEELGAAACITKPFNVNDFVRTIQEVVSAKRPSPVSVENTQHTPALRRLRSAADTPSWWVSAAGIA